MKKYISLLIALTLALTSLGALPAFAANKKLSVVATTFPLYDWARQIVGADNDAVELTLLLDSGVDLHSYQPTADDIIRITSADLFLYVGGVSDAWVADALKKGAPNGSRTDIALLEILGDKAKEEEVVDGMQPGDEGQGEEEEGPEYDEHVWLSLKNASFFCERICDALCGADPDGTETYQKNAKDYRAKIDGLETRYEEMAAGAARRTVLFADRYPFRYLTDDLGLTYYAAFAGCSAETEASFETIVFLSGKVDELSLPCILQIESSDGSIARTVRDNTTAKDQEILTVDSLQSVTAENVDAGVTYLSVMEENLNVLAKALN